ncbi:TRAP transporter small permease [Photobacterium sp. GJ3]|uniref:TRAP transporter small permease n=1 Tax=Photobacterium sp. GJ3 TaxID=2829502 RepID=UPI001B8ABE08|nr:TRAP transporter small permease [Photobacterium sp. GJ3]QUJ68535.1 TRAP transporter small permease [Photobacterium sp. GJ3]
MEKVVSAMNRALSGFTGWLMLIMMLILVCDVVFRTLGAPIQGSAEVSVFVMMIVIYLGLARCEERSEHVRLEFILNMLPGNAKRKVNFLAQLLAVIAVGLLFYAVTLDAWSSYESGDAIEGTVELPIWPTKFVMIFGMVFFLIQTMMNLFSPKSSEEEKTEDPINDELL